MLDTALTLASQTLGTGAKSGALIHCTLTHGGVLKGLANALPSHHFLAPDLPNHGKSADWPLGKEGMQGAAASAIAAMLDAPADVIGHSFGATVALRIAVMHPEKVRTWQQKTVCHGDGRHALRRWKGVRRLCRRG